MTRPNFVIVVADQLRADALGAFGRTQAQTPELDALAARGTTFTNAFVQHSVCAPSRVSFLTGWYPHVRGHRSLYHLLRPSDPNLLRTLKESGYHVTHVGERGDTFAPGATEVSCDEYGYLERPAPTWWGTPVDGSPRTYYTGRIDSSDVLHVDEAAVRTVEGWLADPPRRPWVLYVPLFFPHPPFGVDEPWFSLHDRAAMPPPRPRPSGAEPQYMQAIRDRFGLEHLDPDDWREIAATYAGMVSRLDWHVGRIMRALDASGEGDDSVVAFFSDHGEYLGDYGLIEKWTSGLHDCLVRTPLLLAGPGVPSGARRDALVEMVDLVPTVLELAGEAAPYTHFGRSLLPVLASESAPHREYAFAEAGFTLAEEPLLERAPWPYDIKAGMQHEEPVLAGKAVAVRSAAWTYVWRLYEPPELYDRRADPGEVDNIAGRADLGTVEAELRDAVLRWMVETADVLPWDEDPRRPPVALPTPAGGA